MYFLLSFYFLNEIKLNFIEKKSLLVLLKEAVKIQCLYRLISMCFCCFSQGEYDNINNNNPPAERFQLFSSAPGQLVLLKSDQDVTPCLLEICCQMQKKMKTTITLLSVWLVIIKTIKASPWAHVSGFSFPQSMILPHGKNEMIRTPNHSLWKML